MLNDNLKALRTARETAAIRAAYDDFLAHLDGMEIARRALGVGQSMPPFLLPDAEGRLVASEDLLQRGPLVVTFFRGSWCPYCTMPVEMLEAVLPDVKAAGATLVALTPETGGRTLVTKRSLKLSYEVLADVDNIVGLQFGIVFRTPAMYRTLLEHAGIDLAERHGNPGWFVPIPATFIVGRDGVIRYAWVNVDFTQRAEPSEIVRVLRELRDDVSDPASLPAGQRIEPS